MRARIVFLSALMMLGGCRTPRTPAGGGHLALTPEEHGFSMALAHYTLGSLYEMDLGPNAPDTIEEFELAAEYDPGRHRIDSKIAVGYLLRRQPSKAIAVLEASCEYHPNEIQPRIDLAVTCQLAGRLDEAVAHFERAIDLSTSESALYASVAKIHMFRDDEDAAIATLRRGIRATASPELLQMVSARGRHLIGKKQLNQALRYFNLLWDESRESVTPVLQNLIGQLHLELNEPQEAARAFEIASRGEEPPPETFTKLGATLLHLGRLDEAIAALERGRALYPRHTRLLFSLGLVCNVAHRFEEAVQAFARIETLAAATEGTKLSEEFYVTYGSTCERTGRTLQSETLFTLCLELYPEADQALNYLAYIWAESGENLEQAQEYIDRALAIEPDNAAYLDTQAWIHYRNGDYASALVEMEKAMALMPEDPVLNEHMGDTHDALDHRTEAVQFWTRSLMLDPDSSSVAWKLEAAGADLPRLRREAQRARKRSARHAQ
ncbi:MAG: tetratricopeptide repeat protein [Lentisphaerae bacterium]|nr:tetratricopeptide repeat protein [Lentisphaerota bacterium]